MMHCKNSIQHFYNRLCQWRNLLFFVLTLAACNNTETREVTIIWKDNKASAITIPSSWLKDVNRDSVKTLVHIVSSTDTKATTVLGDYQNKEPFVFEPLIPFLRGMQYDVLVRNKKAGSFIVPFEDGDAPKVMATFPLADTVPENILKIYIQFSHPMSEGRSAQYISLIKNETDTLRDAFLDLQPELWNEDRTVLTMWLDPGRIKRDLQPNLRLGAPLHKKEKYTLFVSSNWKDAQGRSLQQTHTRNFVTTLRDELSPDPTQWKFNSPAAATKEYLSIEFQKPLDHFLLMESLQVKDASGNIVKGIFESFDKDKSVHFSPSTEWAIGKYNLEIDSKLEDLCGNNLNRPFDRDLTKTKQPSTQAYHIIPFIIIK